jgi:hypothetical protein
VRAPNSGVTAVVRVTRVYAASAHLYHDPTDNTPLNQWFPIVSTGYENETGIRYRVLARE